MCWHTLCLCKDSKAAAISKMAEILLGSRMMDPFWCTWYIKVLKDPATRTCWGISMSRIIQVLEPKHGNHCCHLLVSRLVHSGPKKELPWMANWIKIKKHCMGVDSTHCIYLHCVHACMDLTLSHWNVIIHGLGFMSHSAKRRLGWRIWFPPRRSRSEMRALATEGHI